MTKRKIISYIVILLIAAIIWKLSLDKQGIIYTFGGWSIYISLVVSLLTSLLMIFESFVTYGKFRDTLSIPNKPILPFFTIMPILYFLTFVGLLILELSKNAINLQYSDYKVLYSFVYLWLYFGMTIVYAVILKGTGKKYKVENLFSEKVKLFKLIYMHIDFPMALSFTFFTLVHFYFRLQPNDFMVFPDSNSHRFSYFATGGSGLHILTSMFLFILIYLDDLLNHFVEVIRESKKPGG